jgi:hypothetical protein
MRKWLAVLTIFLTLPSLPALAQQGYVPPSKLSPALGTLIAQKKFAGKDSIDLLFTVDIRTGVPAFTRILYGYAPSGTYAGRVAHQDVNTFVADESVLFIDVPRKPVDELTTGAYDLSANHINYLHHREPALRGNGFLVSVKENLFDTTDIDFKGRWINSGLASAIASTHASIMATMLAGGGNSSPYSKGVAPAARITSSSYQTLLPDADAVYRNLGISVQNHSYGVDIENYYGGDAVAYDQSARNNPFLLHVFSAGNIGTRTSTSGPYAGVPNFANLSGSFKMSKNSISVGAIDSFFRIMNASSRGPAYDGRVKPELVAFGEEGSSGAAALVSGTAVLVQQAYRQKHLDSLPTSALVKAVLINAADDIGSPHVDYRSGFGNLDAYGAVQTIQEGRYFNGRLTGGQVQSYAIAVPGNISELKISLAWTDSAGVPNASSALVNDLDLVLRSPTGETWLPWVLNKSALADSLQLPAKRWRDTLNNVEQVTLDAPAPGNYVLEIKGARVFGEQSFSVAYETDSSNRLIWTYPTSSDPLRAGERTLLRWNSRLSGPAVVEYAANGGAWQMIATVADTRTGYLPWITPLQEGLLRFRITSTQTGKQVVSDTIAASRPLRMKVGYRCADSILLYWNKVDTDSFTVYTLGPFYLEPLKKTRDTFIVLRKKDNPSFYYAVSPVIQNREGFRSLTINYNLQGVDCYFTNFLVQLSGSEGLLSTQLGSIHQVDRVVFLKQTTTGLKTLGTIKAQSGMSFQFTDTALSRGINTYVVQVVLTNGQVLTSNAESLFYFTQRPVIVYPNPLRSTAPLNVIADDFDRYSIEVLDASGRLLLRKRLLQHQESIPAHRLAPGIYFIRILDEGKYLYSEKFVVQ